MKTRWGLAVAAALAALAVCSASEQQPLRVGLTKSMFWMESGYDVVGQAQLVADKIGREVGRTMKVEEVKAGATAAFADALVAGDYDFVFTDGLAYVRLRDEFAKRAQAGGSVLLELCPIAGTCIPPNPEEDDAAAGTTSAELLTRNDPAVHSLADLRGKRFVYGPLSEDDSSMLFLEGLVRKQGAQSKEQFFGSVKRLSCEDACFIALLRGSADVMCVSSMRRMAKEMALGGKLKLQTVEVSKPYAAYVCFYVRGRVDPQLASAVRERMMVFHQTAEGQGLLVPFKLKRFAPISDQGLATIEEMIQAAEAEPHNAKPEPARAGASAS